jgi:hypothetical protein
MHVLFPENKKVVLEHNEQVFEVVEHWTQLELQIKHI